MRFASFFFAICFVLFSFACNDSENKKLILGHWTGIEWLDNSGNAGYNAADAAFTFGEDGRYTFSYQNTQEKGDYFISNSQLYTTPDGGIKMMVRVTRLTQDTMVFEMNRGGQPERLTLVRK